MELLLSIKYLICSSKSRAFLLLAVLLAGLPDHVVAANSVNVRAITSSFAPLQVLEDGVPGGYAVDVIGVIAKNISTERGQHIVLNFEFLPWKRGFRAATSDQENILFFSLSRSPGRESQFHWIGEISPYDMHLFTLDPEIPGQLTTLESIRESNKVVGVQGGSNVEELLRSHGFVEDMDFVTYSNYKIGINLLYRRRIDFVPMTSFLARGNVCGQKLNPDLLFKSLHLDSLSQPLWAVFSKSTSPELVQFFREALEAFNSSSRYRNLTDSHITRWTERICEK